MSASLPHRPLEPDEDRAMRRVHAVGTVRHGAERAVLSWRADASRAVPRPQLSDATVSIRLIWPFARLVGIANLPTLSGYGIGAEQYADPDTRVPHRLAIDLLSAAIERTGDPLLGLRAGELVDSGDFDTLEFAARSCATLREACRCVARYTRLLNDAAEIELCEQGDQAILRYRIVDGVVHPPAANDFVLVLLVRHARRQTGRADHLPYEVHFIHSPTSYVNEYERVFGAKIVFDAPCNAFVFPRSYLDDPMLHANPRVSAAFERRVQQLMQKREQPSSVAAMVRDLIAAQLSQGDIAMGTVARKLAMSVATLRRRLDDEGKNFSRLVDDVRAELARAYLSEGNRAASEVGFLLGFSDAPSFHKAFKRWTGQTPAEFRTQNARGA